MNEFYDYDLKLEGKMFYKYPIIKFLVYQLLSIQILQLKI